LVDVEHGSERRSLTKLTYKARRRRKTGDDLALNQCDNRSWGVNRNDVEESMTSCGSHGFMFHHLFVVLEALIFKAPPA
jgi:hypothetical protein